MLPLEIPMARKVSYLSKDISTIVATTKPWKQQEHACMLTKMQPVKPQKTLEYYSIACIGDLLYRRMEVNMSNSCVEMLVVPGKGLLPDVTYIAT